MVLRVLHLVGSPVSDFSADLSRLYAHDCLEAIVDPRRYAPVVAYVTPDARRICLATCREKEWRLERVWQAPASETPLEGREEHIELTVRLDRNQRPVIIAARVRSDTGWVRVFRPNE